MAPGQKPKISPTEAKRVDGRRAPYLDLVHKDSNRGMVTVDSDVSTEDDQAELLRQAGAIIEQACAKQDHWMTSEPRVPMTMMEALRAIKLLTAVEDHTTQWVEVVITSLEELGEDLVDGATKLDDRIGDMLSAFINNHVDSKILEASGIYSSIESFLMCSVDSIRGKALELVNRWRASQHLELVDEEITMLVQHPLNSLARIGMSYGEVIKKQLALPGAAFGLMWAIRMANGGDSFSRHYARRVLVEFAPRGISEQTAREMGPNMTIPGYYNHILADLEALWPDFTECWYQLTSTSDLFPTFVDRWNWLAKHDVGLGMVPGSYAGLSAEIKHTLTTENGNERPGQTGKVFSSTTSTSTNQQYRFETDQHDCGMHGDFDMTSEFYTQNASASLLVLLSSIEDESEYLGNKIFLPDIDEFTAWFDDNTKLCQGVLSNLNKDIAELHAAWPQMLCMIESNIRKSILGKKLYVAMRETLRNMENNVVEYCKNVSKREGELAKADLNAFRTRCNLCASQERYLPSACDLHRIQDKLMGMICRPVKAVSDMEWRRVQRTQADFDEVHSQNLQFKIQKDKLASDLSMAQSRIRALEAKLKTTRTYLEGAERVAEAKAHVEIEKQKSRYYQDVEKGISETSSLLRSQLDAARTEGVLYRQTLEDNEKLSAEMAKMKQEMAHLKAVKSQKEKDCKLAEDATKVITEGYDQLKETAATAETRNAELEADLEKALEDQDHLRSEISKLRARKKSAARPQTSSIGSHATPIPTSREEKHEKELQHLESTIVVWKKTLAMAEAKRDQTKEMKEQVDLRIAHVEKQIQELKKVKNPKTRPSSVTTPWGLPVSSDQNAIMTPVQPTIPIIVHSAVRRVLPDQEQFPALNSRPASLSAVRGDAPVFSSMRIKPPTAEVVAQAPVPRNTVEKNAAGSKKGHGDWQGQHGGRGGWGN